LDEQAITGTDPPQIFKNGHGAWYVRDFGRGLRREHLTQDENREKLRHPQVIGKFGVGLKDALACFDRHHVGVKIRSRHGDITLAKVAKHGFDDIVTLHAIIAPPSDPDLVGTDVVLEGLTDAHVDQAKDFFLAFSGDRVLEETGVGAVLARSNGRGPARIYVRGLVVAEEDNFLFSYNITDLTKPLRRALNRERTNVGRSAYTPRVQKLLQGCTSPAVVDPLVEDLEQYGTGRKHDELDWLDVAVHACRTLAAHDDKVLFVTATQLAQRSALLTHAEDDGYRFLTVPDTILDRLAKEPVGTLELYQDRYERSFQFQFVEPEQLTSDEQAVYRLTEALLQLAGIARLGERIGSVRISTTMRLDETGSQCLGVWEPQSRCVIIRRDQLANRACYAGTLLHEVAHATSGAPDYSRAFQDGLTILLGRIAADKL
jgi:hypothetical protein